MRLAPLAPGACFSTDEETAEAYTDNPGYGGSEIIQVDVEVDPDTVLSLLDGRSLSSGRQARDAWSRLAEAVDQDEDELRADSEQVIHAAIDRASIRKRLANAGFEWVVYEDTFPPEAITWTYLGAAVRLR